MDAQFERLPALLLRPGTRFFPPHLKGGVVSVEYMPAWIHFLPTPEKDLAGTYAVTTAGSLYVKLCGTPGWSKSQLQRDEDRPRIQEPEYLPPGCDGAEDAAGVPMHDEHMLHVEDIKRPPLGQRPDKGGVHDATRRLVWSERIADVQHEDGGDVFVQHETLPQHDYRNYPCAQAPEIELVVQYHCVSLSSALDGICSDPNEPICAVNTPIEEKLSIALGMEGVQPPRVPKDGFYSKQRRVRNKKNGPPISRSKLARMTAADVQEFMKLYPVFHKGKPVDFRQLHLKEVRLKSRGTIQPVLCLHRGPSAGSSPASRASGSM